MADDTRPQPPDGGWGYSPPVPGAPPGHTPGPIPGQPPDWGAPPPTRPRRLPVRPSPVFGGLVAAFVASGVLCAKGVGDPRVWVFAFVVLGWVISLCLHEFAHAAVAWYAGDPTGEARGYLTLNPARYINSTTSIVLPILIVMIGGIALPGGAVMVDRRYVRSRHMRSWIAAAGPLTNLTCAVLCALPLATGILHFGDIFDVNGAHNAFPAALAFLTLLEIIATILNALPIPGFDGFGVIMPYLPNETVRQLMPISRFAWFGLFILLFASATANSAFFGFCDHALSLLGVNHELGDYGQALFTFWRKLQ